MSYATVSGEVAIRNHGTSVVPYVDALIAALDKYYAECDLYEILLYVQRIIENEKISIGSNGQFMKGLVCRLADNLPSKADLITFKSSKLLANQLKASHQQTLTKKLFFVPEYTEPTKNPRLDDYADYFNKQYIHRTMPNEYHNPYKFRLGI